MTYDHWKSTPRGWEFLGPEPNWVDADPEPENNIGPGDRVYNSSINEYALVMEVADDKALVGYDGDAARYWVPLHALVRE